MELMQRLLVFLLLAMSTFGQGTAVTIPIQNASFEQLPDVTPTTGQCFDSIVARSGYPNEMPPSWVRTFRDPIWGSTSIIRPYASNSCGIPGPPDGSWILYIASSTVAQDTGVKPSDLQQPGVGEATGRYMLAFWVMNFDAVYPGYWEAKVTFGHIDPITFTIIGHEFCSFDGWTTQQFSQASFPCLSPDYLLGYWPDENPEAADPNAHIIISLSHTKGWPLLFDKVSLTFTPN